MCTDWVSIYLTIIYLFVCLNTVDNNDKHGVWTFNALISLKCTLQLVLMS